MGSSINGSIGVRHSRYRSGNSRRLQMEDGHGNFVTIN